MNDEERQKLCAWLRGASIGWSGNQKIEPKMAQAADEIERLATLPRPPTGLIEAADYLEDYLEKEISQYDGSDWQIGIRNGLQIAIEHLRAGGSARSAK